MHQTETWFCRYFPPTCRREFLNKYWEYGGRSSNTTHGWAPNNSFLTLPRWVLTLTQTMTKTGRLFHTKPLSFIWMGSMQRWPGQSAGVGYSEIAAHIIIIPSCWPSTPTVVWYLQYVSHVSFLSLSFPTSVMYLNSCALSFTLNGHRQYNI